MRSPPHRRCPSAVVVVVVTVVGGGVVVVVGDPRAIPQPTPTARVAMYVDVVGVAYEVVRRTVVGRLMVVGSGVVVLGYLVPSGLRWTVCSVCLVASTTTSEWMKGRGPCLGRLGS